jgi:hypothetical protein
MIAMGTLHRLVGLFFVGSCVIGCGDDNNGNSGGPGPDNTTDVGTFDGLFDDVVTGFNYPYDIGIVPGSLQWEETAIVSGDILVANYGTSEVLLARDPAGGSAESFYFGGDDGLRGAMAISIPPDGSVWAAFERGGDGDNGGIAVLDDGGSLLSLIDNSVVAGAFANPGGICYGETVADGDPVMFVVNKGDGTLWRLTADSNGDNATAEQVGAGLATGGPGNPGTPPDGVGQKNDLPEGGARGCAYLNGYVYVADAQNSRVVRFDDADVETDLSGAELNDTPADLITYPTDITINSEGALIVISFDNAKAFVSLETPDGGFIDNGIHDLNVNSGNYGTQVADDTIWFTRANNANGALRAITPNQETDPTSTGAFPAQ